MAIGDRIKALRNEHRLTLDDIAKKVHTSRQTIQRYESGKIKVIPSDKIELIAEALNTTPAYLMGWEDGVESSVEVYPVESFTKIPIIATVKAGFGGFAVEDFEGYELCADLRGHSDDYVYFRVYGDSMSPEICEGDLALVRRQPTIESGELAVVVVNGEEGMLKRVKYHENQMIILESFNPAYEPRLIVGKEMREVKIFGKVVKIERKY